MSMEFPRHSEEQIKRYTDRRWWLGLALGDLLDRVADVFTDREALVDDRVRIGFHAPFRYLLDYREGKGNLHAHSSKPCAADRGTSRTRWL